MSPERMVISRATVGLRSAMGAKKKPGPASREGFGCAGPGVGTTSGGDAFLFGLIHRQADQVVEGAQRSL